MNAIIDLSGDQSARLLSVHSGDTVGRKLCSINVGIQAFERHRCYIQDDPDNASIRLELYRDWYGFWFSLLLFLAVSL